MCIRDRGFLERLAKANERTRKSRLKMIEACLKQAVPRLQRLSFEHDETGTPHLAAIYSHWRARGARQREEQFSDGTLRLLAMIWSLLDGNAALLLEEPEISLHAAIVDGLAGFIHHAQRKRKRQVLLSTHSTELLSDKGISPQEVLLLSPADEGTKVEVCSDLDDVKSALAAGASIGEAVRFRTSPSRGPVDLPI